MKTLGAVIMAVGLLWTTAAVAWQRDDFKQEQMGQTLEEFLAKFGQPTKPWEESGGMKQLHYTVQQEGFPYPSTVTAIFRSGKLVDLSIDGFHLKDTGVCGRTWYGRDYQGTVTCFDQEGKMHQ